MRNGFGGIKVTYDIDADAKREDIEAPLGMDLAAVAIKTIIWATGYRPDYSWLEVPVLDRKGMIRHDGGIVGAPGIYLIGAVFLRGPLKSRASSPAPSIRVDLRVLSREPFCAVKACQCSSCLRGLHGGMPGAQFGRLVQPRPDGARA